ncbi:hypothetical protein TNCT_468611 [Trichonephila clavata]|uniref:Uncharacterized protein n=1 Tax=Trichonephila clavata TaxID=2740835 RepID=A0A8X6GQJ2_TRICU|nr:hypothetical protein TNCT_468611 [Trichonephila clavata]
MFKDIDIAVAEAVKEFLLEIPIKRIKNTDSYYRQKKPHHLQRNDPPRKRRHLLLTARYNCSFYFPHVCHPHTCFAIAIIPVLPAQAISCATKTLAEPPTENSPRILKLHSDLEPKENSASSMFFLKSQVIWFRLSTVCDRIIGALSTSRGDATKIAQSFPCLVVFIETAGNDFFPLFPHSKKTSQTRHPIWRRSKEQSASRTASGEEKTAFRENDDTPSPPRSSSFPPKRTEARHRRIPSRKTEPPENVLDGSVTNKRSRPEARIPKQKRTFVPERLVQ